MKFLTLESYSALPLEAQENYVQGLREQEQSLLDQYGRLEKLGGTSRAFAMGYQEVLPEGVALESFTTNVSKTNYAMSLEALSTGMRLVLAAAAIAAVGGLLFYLAQASKRKIPKGPSGAQIRTAGKAFTIVSTGVASPAMVELKRRVDQFQQANEEFMAKMDASQNLSKLAQERGINYLTCMVLGGQYDFLSNVIGLQAIDNDVSRMSDHVIVGIGQMASAVIRKGKDVTLEEIRSYGRLEDLKFHTPEKLDKYGKANGIDGSTSDGLAAGFRAKMLKPAPPADVASASFNAVQGITKGSIYIKPWEASIEYIIAAQTELNSLHRSLEQSTKAWAEDDDKVPKDVIAYIRSYVEAAKSIARCLDIVFVIVAEESRAWTEVSSLQGKSVSDHFRSLVLALELGVQASQISEENYKDIRNDLKAAHEAAKGGDESGFEKSYNQAVAKIGSALKEGKSA